MALRITWSEGGAPDRVLGFDDGIERVAIGRDPDRNQVVTPASDLMVGREHVVLERRLGRYRVILGPSNPIRINGRRGHDGDWLPPEAELQIGVDGPILRVDTIRDGKIGKTQAIVRAFTRLPGRLTRLSSTIHRQKQRVFLIYGLVLVCVAAMPIVLWYLGRLREEASADEDLRSFAQNRARSVVFLEVIYGARDPTDGSWLSGPGGSGPLWKGEGTGFLVGDGTWVVTARHVVDPLSFVSPGSERAARCQYWDDTHGASGWEPALSDIVVWHCGDRYSRSDRRGALCLATEQVEVVARGPLDPTPSQAWRAVGRDDATLDLALLRLRPSRPLREPLPLAPSCGTEARRVAVLGFPEGQAAQKGGSKITCLSVFGELVAVNRFLRLDARIAPGLSGGPVIDRHGAAVGIVRSRIGDAPGLCTPVSALHRWIADLRDMGRDTPELSR